MKLSIGLLALIAFSTINARASSRVIGGTEVVGADWEFAVKLDLRDTTCTGSVVGKNSIITAAHCVPPTITGEVDINGVTYDVNGKRSPVYPVEDHDIALLVTNQELPYKPALLSSSVNVGDSLFVLGYGCNNIGGSGGGEGLLRRGDGTVVDVLQYDSIVKGAALCFGDSGGPAVLRSGDRPVVVGFGSKGNLHDTSYFVRIDTVQTSQFLQRMVADYGAEICGFNVDCP